MRFFFYGTLIDPDVRRIVLGGASTGTIHIREATLPDWERRAARGVSFPIIIPKRGSRVDGLLVSGLDTEARRALVGFEGNQYTLMRASVFVSNGTREVVIFVPAPGGSLKAEAHEWSYAQWCATEKQAFIKELLEAPKAQPKTAPSAGPASIAPPQQASRAPAPPRAPMGALPSEILALLERHHLWLTSHGQSGAQANLSDKDYRGVDFGGQDLSGANFSRCNLTGAKFAKARLEMASFEGAILRGVDFAEANLDGCMLAYADLSDADLGNATLRPVDIRRPDGSPSGRRWPANLSRASLVRTRFFCADLTGANLRGVDLTGADLSGAQLDGTNMADAITEGATMPRQADS